MQEFRVLVSGSGISGPVAAHCLHEAGCKVTVIERASEFRHSGQGIDIRGAAVDVIRRMGVEEAIRKSTTNEEGIAFVDENNVTQAAFPLVEDGKGFNFTSDIEIMRGNLTRILESTTKDKVEYRFNTMITSLKEDSSGVDVQFNNQSTTHRFDFVMAADGLFSRTRGMLLGESIGGSDPVVTRNTFCAYFSLPRTEQDTGFSRLLNVPGRRGLFLRPVDTSTCSAYMTLLVSDTKQPELRELVHQDAAKQKAYFKQTFADVGWEAPRILAAMEDANDFYLQEVAQTRMSTWSSPLGHGACVGDAAHCPSPLSGMGTTVAIIAPYVLAGELARQIKLARKSDGSLGEVDMKQACTDYERLTRPYVERAQNVPNIVPKLANPETSYGIWVLRKVVGFASWSGLSGLLGSSFSPAADWKDMPEYEFAT